MCSSSKFQSLMTIIHPSTNISSLESSTGLHPSVIGTCRFKILYWVQGSLGACVHDLAHSSGPLNCGWIAAYVLLHAFDPLLSRIWQPSSLHVYSPLVVLCDGQVFMVLGCKVCLYVTILSISIVCQPMIQHSYDNNLVHKR